MLENFLKEPAAATLNTGEKLSPQSYHNMPRILLRRCGERCLANADVGTCRFHLQLRTHPRHTVILFPVANSEFFHALWDGRDGAMQDA